MVFIWWLLSVCELIIIICSKSYFNNSDDNSSNFIDVLHILVPLIKMARCLWIFGTGSLASPLLLPVHNCISTILTSLASTNIPGMVGISFPIISLSTGWVGWCALTQVPLKPSSLSSWMDLLIACYWFLYSCWFSFLSLTCFCRALILSFQLTAGYILYCLYLCLEQLI